MSSWLSVWIDLPSKDYRKERDIQQNFAFVKSLKDIDFLGFSAPVLLPLFGQTAAAIFKILSLKLTLVVKAHVAV